MRLPLILPPLTLADDANKPDENKPDEGDESNAYDKNNDKKKKKKKKSEKGSPNKKSRPPNFNDDDVNALFAAMETHPACRMGSMDGSL